MIKISIIKNNNLIQRVTVKGHALYDEAGKDIVCSAVSSIVITTVNAIVRINSEAIVYEEKDAFVDINVIKHSDIIDLLLENMTSLLSELQTNYKKYIKINEEV